MPSRPIPDNRVCYTCGSGTTYINKRGRAIWFANRGTDLFLCSKCCQKYFDNPKRSPKYKGRQMWFKDRKITLRSNPRTGICSRCGMKRLTGMHHFAEYHDDDPLKDTIELCMSCHTKETWRLGQPIGKPSKH